MTDSEYYYSDEYSDKEYTILWDLAPTGNDFSEQNWLLGSTRASDLYNTLLKVVKPEQIVWRGDGVVKVDADSVELYRILLQTGLYSPRKIFLRNF